jgi:hypothetical protein
MSSSLTPFRITADVLGILLALDRLAKSDVVKPHLTSLEPWIGVVLLLIGVFALLDMLRVVWKWLPASMQTRIGKAWKKMDLSLLLAAVGLVLLVGGLTGYFIDRSRGPIIWGQPEVNGMRREPEGTYVTNLRITGTVRGAKPVRLDEAFIESGITGRRLDAKIAAKEGTVPVTQANPIPPDTIFPLHVLFYDPGQNVDREGMPESEFMNEWGRFAFVVRYQGYEIRRNVTAEDVTRDLARLLPTASIRPTPTVRQP